MEQRRKCNHFFLPVFYHVDPSDVRNQRGIFAIELKIDDVSRWKQALTDVANLTGMVLSGSRFETDFITEVVDIVQYKLDLKQLSTPAHLTGMESRIKDINSWLKNDQSNAIAICGMGGSGKTTLAQCIYNLNKRAFESSSFVEEIGKHYKHSLLGLQERLLKDVLGGKKIMISSVSEGTQKIEEVLQKKKVLIVLDDIDDQDELSSLLGTKAFLTQSKIIITTRLLDIHAWFGSISWRCSVHKLKFLNDNESLELLSWHAFGSKIPMQGFENLAVQLAKYCGGNPLALKGSNTIEGLALNMHKVGHGMRSEASALKTSSLAKMDKLKLLRLKYVELTGSYKNFPELRWLCWRGCPLKTMPSGLMTNSLVAIDMSYGHVKIFEVPTVISSLKILKLEACYKLVSICNLHRLPKLETLMLQNCSRLSHLCKSIGDLQSLANLYLTGCAKLWKASSSNKCMYQLERVEALYIGGGIPEQALLFLPQSLIVLDLSYCDLGYNNDVHVVFNAQSLFNLFLWRNPFEYLPSNIDLNMLRILSLYSCPNLKSLLCMPSTLVELHIDQCKSLERVTFQSGRFSLQRFGYICCFKLSEIQGLFKLVPIAKIEDADLGHMQWIKAY